MKRAIKMLLAGTTALALAPAAAFAQGAASTGEASESALPEVVVTATRRAASQQEVPVTVVAVSGEALDQLQIKNTADLAQLAPGLTIVRSGGIVPFVRGVGASNAGFTTEMPVAVYLDGIYMANSSSGLFTFNSIERIEVLKGPQGTLYGRNSTGGLIHVITRDPSAEPRLDASVGYGNYDTASAKLYASGPLSDTVSANIAAVYSRQGKGFGRNVTTGNDVLKEKQAAVLTKVLWAPTDATSVELRGFYNETYNDQGIAPAVLPGAVGVDGSRYLGEYLIANRRDPYARLEQYNISLRVEHEFGFARLLSLTAYNRAEQPLRFTQTGIPGNPVTGQGATELDLYGRSRTFTQELQLMSADSEARFQWIAGLFYLQDDTYVRSDTYGTCVGAVCAGTPPPTRVIGEPTTMSISGFGEGTYQFTERTGLTLGLRYTSDEKELTGDTQVLPGRPNSPAVLAPTVVRRPGDPYAGNPRGIDPSVTFSQLTYKAVLSHDFTDEVHGYVSFNRGFKSGGYNPIAFTNPPSRPEVLDAFEVGLKSELLDRRLRLNVAAFRYDYKDIQLRSTAPPAPPGGSVLINAARARVNGASVDFEFAPIRPLRFSGGVEYLDAHYVSFPGGTCVSPRPIGGAVLGGSVATPCDLSGARLPQSPRWSYNFAAVYTMETSVGDVALAVNDSYKSEYAYTSDGRFVSDPYHLVSASATWTSQDERFDVQLYVRNLTDTYYTVTKQGATGGNDIYLAGMPRTYGFTIGYHY